MEAYPLQWPVDYPRSLNRSESKFKNNLAKSQSFLHDELRRMGAIEVIVSTNLPVNRNGLIANTSIVGLIHDPGVATYFKWKDEPFVICCDQYFRVWENMTALGKTVEALRGIDRWGASDFIKRAFTGFKALPAATMAEEEIWGILGLQGKPRSVYELKGAFKERVKVVHPDTGGSAEQFHRLQEAYSLALKIFGE